jgi:hypothetical protein
MRPAVLMLLIDGLPASKLPRGMPLQCYVGFRGVEASLFTGTETAVHGVWTDYRRGDASPYAWVGRIPGLVPAYNSLGRRGRHLVGAAAHQWTRAANRNPSLPKSSLVPLDILAHMEFTSARLPWARGAYGAIPSLFDHLRRHDRSFVCLAPPSVSFWRTTDDTVMRALQKCLAGKRHDFYYVKLVDLDHVSHRHGPDSEAAVRAMARSLREAEEAMAMVRARAGDVRTVVLSDHGFLSVERHVSVEQTLREWRRRFGDFLYFLDSTLVRCWCRNEVARERLTSYLDTVVGLTPLDDELRRRYGLDQLPSAYGDLVYVADHGWVVWPDFFRASPPCGMHGYLPHPELEAGIRVDGFETSHVPSRFAHVLPLLLSMLEIEPT